MLILHLETILSLQYFLNFFVKIKLFWLKTQKLLFQFTKSLWYSSPFFCLNKQTLGLSWIPFASICFSVHKNDPVFWHWFFMLSVGCFYWKGVFVFLASPINWLYNWIGKVLWVGKTEVAYQVGQGMWKFMLQIRKTLECTLHIKSTAGWKALKLSLVTESMYK